MASSGVRICIVDGCERLPTGRMRMCWPHYRRLRKYGSTDAGRPVSPTARFWAKVDKKPGHGPDGSCWAWTGVKAHGYGRAAWDGGVDGTHRIAWLIAHGAIPDGLYVLHRCDNRACVNDSHLFLGTPADNMHDMHSKGRAVTPRYLAGDEWRAARSGSRAARV